MSNLYYDLLQPQNYLAEEILLGHIVNNPNSFNYILQNINIEYFFLESHKIIYRHLNAIHYENKINIVNLIYSLQDKKILNKIGNLTKIIELIKQSQIFTSSINKKFYLTELLNIIYENYTKRLIIQYAYNIIQLSYNQNISSQQIYIKASEYLNYINNKVSNKNLGNLKNLIGHLITSLQNNNNSIELNKSIYSGFKALDILTDGLPNGDLIVIAGRPSMGKTSLVINIAYNILQDLKTRICIFSLEMTKMQILHKLISIGSTIPIQFILAGKISINQWYIVQDICKQLIASQIYINDTANITIEDINYISQLIIKENNSKIITIIDYLQLIQIRNLQSESRVQELGYITRQLKILAQNLNIPIIILSQLNRRIDTRINKKPLLSDLKESGCLKYNLLLNINYRNQINIQTKIYSTISLLPYLIYKFNINHTEYILQYNYNYINKIELFIEQIFYNTTNYISPILITENHPLLNTNRWYKQHKLKEGHNIIRSNLNFDDINLIEKTSNISIYNHQYYTVYNVARIEYTNFIYNSLILHNSIEQDADIVIMLYCTQSEKNTTNLLNAKIIDIIISKNRNGSIGSFQLLFNLPNTIFKDTSIY